LDVSLSRLIYKTTVIAMLAAIILAVSGSQVRAQSADSSSLDSVSSQRYIVIDAKTGEIFAEKDADVRGGIASLTKVFTAIVALERAPLDLTIVAQESDEFDATSSTMTGFVAGETFTMQDLLYGMLLESGNDAATALARGVAALEGDTGDQSVDRFVGWMNDKVADLGLTDTHFVNPHGLSDPDHYSTPRDIATFMMYAVQNADFMAVISTRTYTTSTGIDLTSINRGPEFIPDYIGGKTGYDDATGYCLIEIGQRDDAQLVSVTIDGVAPDVWYQDHAILLDYGFATRADRLASGDPVGDNVLALAQQPEDSEPQGTDEGDEVTPPADVAVADVDTAPRPVLVTGTPAPITRSDHDRGDVFDNWFIGGLVAVVVAVMLWMRSGVHPVRPPSQLTDDVEIDT
jgi:serine-type D-Ala-D-Ala carboxypeptidase (penicillin-binding protein 5/6)